MILLVSLLITAALITVIAVIVFTAHHKVTPVTAEVVPVKTAKQTEFEECLQKYLRHRFPQMRSFRVLNPCSAPRSARFVEVEVEMPGYTFRKDFETMLIW